jgi:cation diffusion facilitator family transporter
MTAAATIHTSQRPDAQRTRMRAGWLAVAAAIVTITLKFVAWWLTGSAGLLSDAVESLANLATAVAVLVSLWYASRPVDRSHNYGHGKVEFFASGIEGVVILFAAGSIAWIGVNQLLAQHELESLGAGSLLALVATAVNLVVGRMLIRVGERHRSPALAADGHHIMTDVWTTAGVLTGLAVVAFTGWLWVDGVIALVLAANIARTGWKLIRGGFDGLMDRALPAGDELAVRRAIEGTPWRGSGDATYHALRTRAAGDRRFVDFHLLVPSTASVAEAHAFAEELESVVDGVLPGVETTIHIEPIEAEASWEDSALLPIERRADAAPAERTGTGRR